jgi:hypothetical protein
MQKLVDNNGKHVVEMAEKPVKHRISPPVSNQKTEDKVEDEQMEAGDFLESEPDFDVLVNLV